MPVIGEFVAEEGDEAKTVAVRAMTFIAKPECIPYLAQVLEKTQDQELLRNTFSLLAKIDSPQAIALLEAEVASGKGSRQASAVWALSRSANSTFVATLSGAISRNGLEEQSLGIIAKSPAAPAVFGNAFATGLSKEEKLYLFQVMGAYSMSAPGSVRNEIADMLKPLLNSSDPDLERAAVKALGKSGAMEDQSEVLVDKFESSDLLVRGSALEAFAQYCTPSNYKPLKLLWSDQNQQIRRTAFFLSESFLNQSDLGDLQKATSSSDEFVAKHAGLMIKHITQGQQK
jgi:HEAT repeat protein